MSASPRARARARARSGALPAALALSALALALAGCGGGSRTRRLSAPLSSAALRATPAWSCLRIEDVTDGPGLTTLEALEDAGLRFYRLPPTIQPKPGPGTRCVGLFEQPEVAAETLAGFSDTEEGHPGAVRLQHLTASQVRALPPFARAVAWVSAPMDFTGDESAGPLELDRSPDGRTVLLYVQDSARGDLTEGRLHVLNSRVGRVEVFAAWDFVLAEGRLVYGTARLLSDADGDSAARDGEAATARELGVTTSALRSASFFDRATASTQVVSLATYDPSSGRAVELGQLGGGTLALAGAQVVATLRPLWWELSHADSDASGSDATTLSRIDVLTLQGSRLRPVTTPALGVGARRALDAKLRGRERALAEGSAAVGTEAQRMLAQLTPPETGQRAVGELRLRGGEVLRLHGNDFIRLFDGQLRALTRDGSYGFVRLGTGRYVAMHFLPW